MAYIHRTLEPIIQQVSKQMPALLVVGPRQVGKSTLLQHLSKSTRSYVTLDDPLLVHLAKTDPALFCERFEPPVLIDEIQYAPELLPHIKMRIDRDKQPGQYWLTGSQQFHLMKGVSESLAGRVAVTNLLGLSLAEQQAKPRVDLPFLPLQEQLQKKQADRMKMGLIKTYEHIWRGSFPAMLSNPKLDRDLFYRSYVQTYLQRDVRDLAKVGDEMTFLKFLRAVAARTGQLLNFSDLARDVDVSPNTAKNWLSILKASNIIYLLEPYHTNLSKRLSKTPKLYFLDTGLCCYLTNWSNSKTLESGAMSGAIFETFVVSEIIKSYWHNGKEAPLFYYRDKDKKEIDLLIFQDQEIFPIEIKKTASPSKDSYKNFTLLDRFGEKIKDGGVVCLCEQLLPMKKNINAIPVGFV